jgi:Tfp pilus assembly protein PilE
MNRLPLSKAAPLRRVNSRLAIVVVLVLAAGALLALPATADAHVVKAHRAQYAKMLHNWKLTHSQMEQYFDLESGSLNSLSNDMSPLIGSPDPGAQARLQVDEMAAQAAAPVLAKAATNGRDRVDKKIVAAKNKVRRSWFTSRKGYLSFVVNMFPVMIYFTDYWNALDKLSAAAQALSTGDIATYDSGALDALNLENEGNANFTTGIAALKALL